MHRYIFRDDGRITLLLCWLKKLEDTVLEKGFKINFASHEIFLFLYFTTTSENCFSHLPELNTNSEHRKAIKYNEIKVFLLCANSLSTK